MMLALLCNRKRRTYFSATCWIAILVIGLNASAAVAREDADAEKGFRPLFDGQTLEGWQGSVDGYTVEDGAIVCIPDKGGNLFTVEEFADFVLRFQFKLTPGANNGLGIRSPLTGDPAYVGMELQILDDSADRFGRLKPYQYHGSVYGVVPAKRGHQRPVGQWNDQQVTCQGTRVRVTLNGAVILDADVAEVSRNGTPDGQDHPGLKRRQGHIGFLGHGSRIEVRNIRIQELPAE